MTYHNIKFIFFFAIIAVVSCTTPTSGTRGDSTRSKSDKEPVIRVLIAENKLVLLLTISGDFTLKAPEGSYVFNPEQSGIKISNKNNELVFSSESRSMKFQSGTKIFFIPRDQSNSFSVNGISYDEKIEIVLENGNISIVSLLPLEKYLTGVVPNEIPSYNRSGYEAVKAQAIAARTYALKRMAIRSDNLFHVYGDHRDQVFNGLVNRSKLATDAVIETKGEVLFYKDKPIDASYHSTSGGITEDYASVWGDTTRPYLPVQYDAIDEVLSSESPYNRWQFSFSPGTIEKKLYKWLKLSLPDNKSDRYYKERTVSMKISERTKGLRVNQLRVQAGEYELILNSRQIRQFLANEEGRNLPSRLFTIVREKGDF